MRLVHCIETGGQSAFLTADAGLGKSTVLRRVLAETRSVRRRCFLMSCPRDGTLLLGHAGGASGGTRRSRAEPPDMLARDRTVISTRIDSGHSRRHRHRRLRECQQRSAARHRFAGQSLDRLEHTIDDRSGRATQPAQACGRSPALGRLRLDSNRSRDRRRSAISSPSSRVPAATTRFSHLARSRGCTVCARAFLEASSNLPHAV